MSNSKLAGRRVLVVEDEVLIGLVLEDILDMLGCAVAGNAATLDEARSLIGEKFDIAVLDVNLGGEPVYPLADTLMARGVPMVFATGAMPETLPERFKGCPVLEKPYALASVEAVLTRAVAEDADSSPSG